MTRAQCQAVRSSQLPSESWGKVRSGIASFARIRTVRASIQIAEKVVRLSAFRISRGGPKGVVMRNGNNCGKVAGAAGFERCTIGFGGPTLCQLSYAPLSSSETIGIVRGRVNIS